ncbi:hypothetical protein A8B84_08410 [Marinobacter sp. EhC06]|jgi:DNA ligase-1|uniref:hypothetical protein n=1 Tax=Marinobacter TaxID=2742 RepID=UPI0007F4F85E|nr:MULTISPECIES: hypothetical protein [unclassified Marinobacter]OAN91603.1 hypothetical protein A8B84_08410 [Marinobacter sp. EhC06]
MPFRFFSVALPVLISLLFSSVAVAKPPGLTLANVYQKGMPLEGYWISENLDGVRAYWTGERFLSRGGHEYRAPGWFTRGFPERPLDGALKVHIRRFKEVHRPNPGSGGTTVVKTELQDLPDGDWWIHRRFLPDGIEYWLETPRPSGWCFTNGR